VVRRLVVSQPGQSVIQFHVIPEESLFAVHPIKILSLSAVLLLGAAGERACASRPPGRFDVDQPAEAAPEVLRVQQLFRTPTPVGNGPGTFLYSPLSSFQGNVYYVWPDDARRPQIVQIRPDGSRAVASLEQPDYQAVDDGHNRFSLGLDAKGFIHVAGDMHGGVNDSKLTAVRFKGAHVLYWRSKRPGDISEFEFLGKDPKRTIPMPAATYAFFLRDRNGVLYFAGRIVANPDRKNVPEAHRGVGLYRYDPEAERWVALGGTLNPVNHVQLEKTLFNSVNKWGNLTSEDTPIWYRWNMVGMCFDQHNRLHFAVNANTPMGEGTHAFYAASDDGGETWQRADGTRVELPMIDSLVPHPNRPDMIFAPEGDDLATSGPTYPFFNNKGMPAVSVSMKVKAAGPSHIKYVYWLDGAKKWSDPVDSPVPKSFNWTKNFYLGRDGLINFVDSNRLFRAPDFEMPGQMHKVPGEMAFIDPISLLEENIFLAVLHTGAGRTAVCRLDFLKVPAGGWSSGYDDLKDSALDEKVAQLEAGRAKRPGKMFRPADPITAGEWVDLILEARRWKAEAIRDPAANWKQASAEGIAKIDKIPLPTSPLSKALLISMLVRSAPGEAWPETMEHWQKSIPGDGLDPGIHTEVALATALGLVPENWVKASATLHAPATRGDAVELLYRLYFPEARKKQK